MNNLVTCAKNSCKMWIIEVELPALSNKEYENKISCKLLIAESKFATKSQVGKRSPFLLDKIVEKLSIPLFHVKMTILKVKLVWPQTYILYIFPPVHAQNFQNIFTTQNRKD